MDGVYIIDCLIIVLIALTTMIWFSRVIDLSFKFQAAYTSFMTISTQMTDPSTSSSAMSSLYQQFNSAESEVISVCSTMIDNYDIFMDLIILQTTYFVKNLFQILFAKLRNKKLQIITPEICINFASFTASVYLFCRWKFYYQNLSAPIPKYWTLYVANETFNDPFLKGAFGAGLVVSLQWCRVFFILQASRTFGPLIEILLHMLKELFKFIAIYGLIFTVFISAGMCMFFNYSEFSNDNWRGFLYLFSVSLGNFDFSLFTQNEEYLERQYGWVYLVLFLVFTNIILINFLIAILSNKYSEMELNKKVLYNRKILEIKQVQAYDKYYSSLISSFAPLNLLILPFVPFLVICKSQRLNTVLLYASYIPMAFFGVLIFTIGSVILLPFAYLAAIYSSILTFCINLKINRLTTKLVAFEILWIMVIIIALLPYLIVQTVFDIVMFGVTLFDENTKTKQECSKIHSNSVTIDQELFSILNNIIENNGEQVDVKSVIHYFRDKFCLIDQISALLYNLSSIKKYNNADKQNEEIKMSMNDKQISYDTLKLNNFSDNFDQKNFTKYSPREAIDQYNAIKAFLLKNTIKNLEITDLTKSKIEKSLEKKKSMDILNKSSYLKLIQELKDNISFRQIVNKKSNMDLIKNKAKLSSQIDPENKMNFLHKKNNSGLMVDLQMLNISRNFISLEQFYTQIAKQGTLH